MVALARLRSKAEKHAWREAPGRAFVGSVDTTARDTAQSLAVRSADTRAAHVVEEVEETAKEDRQEIQTDSPPVRHIVPTDVAEFFIPDFRTGTDCCDVKLAYPDIDFMHWKGSGLAGMTFFDGNETLTVIFHGLDIIPSADINVHFEQPYKGKKGCRLAELLNIEECEISEQQATEQRGIAPEFSRLGGSDEDAPMEFKGFDVDNECIEVFVPYERAASTSLEIQISDNGADACIVVDGHVVAILRDARRATQSNVKLVAKRQTVAA